MLAKIAKTIKEKEMEATNLDKVLTTRLESYTKQDFLSYENQSIIIEVREIKQRIEMCFAQLQ